MARRRYGRRRYRHSARIPLLTTMAIAFPFVRGYTLAGGLNRWMGAHVIGAYTGFNAISGAWEPARLKEGWGPLLAVAGFKLLNRAFIHARMPKGLPISLS